jgi:ParB-like chromosome segregation protein Spo0J
MAVEIQWQEIPLNAVDLGEHPLMVSPPPDLSRLRAAIQEVGLLSPVWLRTAAGERWQLVTGLKRLLALKQLGWPRVPARVLPAGTPDSHCLLIALYDNALTRGFNPLEQALYAARLLNHWDRPTVVAKFLPYLGLPASFAHLDRLLALTILEDPFKQLSAQGRLALSAAALLAQWEREDRMAALPFLVEMHWSQSKQEEFLEFLSLLSRRDDQSPAAILARQELQEYLKADRGSPAERAEAVRRVLKRSFYPRLNAAQEAFQAALNRLGLGRHPRFRLKAPPAFEGPDFQLELKFRDAPELRSLLEELAHLVAQEEFSNLTRL